MSKQFKVGDRVAATSVEKATYGVVTQVEGVPDSPDTGMPRLEVQWEDGGAHQYWEINDLIAAD